MQVVTADSVAGKGSFRTIGMFSRDTAGSVLVHFVRSEGKWFVFSYLFIATPSGEFNSLPKLAALGPDAPPGADGWITLFDGSGSGAWVDSTAFE
ncbi:MAG: hypothetical protein FJW36_16890 [Acidobacteria bacterium]|nr:hypothetical protein [Acidobacteriota bacterium]